MFEMGLTVYLPVVSIKSYFLDPTLYIVKVGLGDMVKYVSLHQYKMSIATDFILCVYARAAQLIFTRW